MHDVYACRGCWFAWFGGLHTGISGTLRWLLAIFHVKKLEKKVGSDDLGGASGRVGGLFG